MENLLNHLKVSKFYEHDCRSTYSFGKLVLVAILCFLCFLLFLCYGFNITICIIIIYVNATCSVISHFTVYKNINLIKSLLYLQFKSCFQRGFELFSKKCIYKENVTKRKSSTKNVIINPISF